MTNEKLDKLSEEEISCKINDFDKLRWIRILAADLIPKYLVEQIRDREFTVDDFYKYQNLNCLIETEKGKILNPFNHLYVLANEENIVKGFLWFVIDALTKDIIINTFSMDEAYWENGKAVKILTEHVKKLLDDMKLKKVYWITKYPKHSQRHGFKKSKWTLMEYKHEEEEKEEKEN